ncbi:MAG: Ig-like domain-containing protein [Sphingobacteriales bacterium]
MKKSNFLFLSAIALLSIFFVSCKKETLSPELSQSGDLARKPSGGGTKPSVNFIYPTNGSTVTGTITVQVAASSSLGIKNTALMITIGTSNCFFGNDAIAPYEYIWDSNYSCISKIAPGTQVTLRATATDNAGVTNYTDIIVTKQ